MDPDNAEMRDEVARLRTELESAEDREAALHDVIQSIARSTFDLDAVLQTVIGSAVKMCHGDTGNIARQAGDGTYRVVAFTSFGAEYEQLVRERVYVPERGSVIGRTVLERRPRVHARRPAEGGRVPDRPRRPDPSAGSG
jgi:hypothetical protein